MLPKQILKQWIKFAGNGYFTVENDNLVFIRNTRPIFRKFNIFGLANLFHELGKFEHFEFIKFAMACDYVVNKPVITTKSTPIKQFNLSPNYIFQLPKTTLMTKITFDCPNLIWTQI